MKASVRFVNAIDGTERSLVFGGDLLVAGEKGSEIHRKHDCAGFLIRFRICILETCLQSKAIWMQVTSTIALPFVRIR